MQIKYEKKFLKDLGNIDIKASRKLKALILRIKHAEGILDINNIKKMSGYLAYYRIRIGDYRLGIKLENNALIFIRFKHRKDIYKTFP